MKPETKPRPPEPGAEWFPKPRRTLFAIGPTKSLSRAPGGLRILAAPTACDGTPRHRPCHSVGGPRPMKDTVGHNKSGPGVSRRDFLRGSGAAAAAAATALAPLPPAAEAFAPTEAGRDPVAVGPGAVKLTLDVNGAKMETKVEPRV